jgi:DNA-binding SARP family transcriptional activator
VLWVSGSAGSGKTSLVSSYADNRGLPCLWYQLDEGDSDPAALFHYLKIAVRFCSPEAEDILPSFMPDHLCALTSFSHSFFESLFDCLPRGCLLTLDDHHEVPRDCPFHEILLAGLSRIPAGNRVIVISRKEPPPSLARLRANGQMAHLGWDALRLTDRECREVVLSRTGKTTPEREILDLQAWTDGWAAGLVLMLDGRVGTRCDKETLDALPPEEVFDYFAGEIVARIDGPTRRFLCRSALLPRMTAESACRLTGTRNAPAILRSLMRENLFINRCHASDAEYQYHPLFRSFLLSKLATSTPAADLRELRQLAARIMEEKGSIEEALSLLHACADWEAMTGILLDRAPELADGYRFHTLERWLAALPEASLRSDPWLVYWMGVCRALRFPDQAQQLFIESYGRFQQRGDPLGALLAWSGIADTHLLVFATFKSLDEWIAEIDWLLDLFPGFPSFQTEVAVTASLITALCLRCPDHPLFETLLERSKRLAENGAEGSDKLRAYLPLAFCRLFQGHFHEVNDLMQIYGKHADGPGISPLLKIMQRDLEAFFGWKACRFDQCRQAARNGLAVAEKTGISAFRCFLCGHAAAAALSQGNAREAEQMLGDFAALMDAARSWEKSYYRVMRTWSCLLVGDLTGAERSADLGLQYALEAGENESVCISHLGMALVCQSLGEEAKAGEYLKVGRRLGFAGPSWFTDFAYRLADAQFALERGDMDGTREILALAFRLGRQQGYFNSYFWNPSLMSRLCSVALESGIEPEYTREMIRRREIPTPEGIFRVPEWPFPVKILTFGRLELSVDGQDPCATGKTPQRPLDLLKAILALGGREVSKNRICDLLWPDSSGDAALSALSTNLQRLRRLLGGEERILLRQGVISLNERFCWVDLWQLEALLHDLRILWRKWPAETGELRARQLLRMASDIHTKTFLEDEPDEPSCAAALRTRLQKELSGWHLQLGRRFEALGRSQEAVHHYLSGRAVEPGREELYQRLIACYAGLGLRAEAVAEYRRCRAVLREHFACEPSRRTRDMLALI